MRVALSLVLVLFVAGTAAAATVVGTPADDHLAGTPQADTIFGRGGRDVLLGGAGGDLLDGGAGPDLLEGGAGNDRIAAQYDGSRDTVRCGPGRDVVNADLADVVAPDCELVGLRLSRDPYTNRDSQHETEVEPDSLTVGATTVAAFQVGRRFEGGAVNIGFAVSRDDGRTWRSGLLPGLTSASRPPGLHELASDPVVAFDAATGTWLISTLAIEGRTTRLAVSSSADGLSWSAPVVAAEGVADRGISFDKNWIACDNGDASPFRGSCYLAFTDVAHRDALGVATSTDGGLTWGQPVLAPVTDVVGAFPVIRPTGELVVPFLWSGRRIGAAVSTDGAATFGPPVEVGEVRTRSARGLRFPPLPSADVDPSGAVWVAWHDCRFSSGCSSNAVVVSTSTDGVTWSAPTAVTPERNAMLPALGIDPETGRVAVAYHVVRRAGIDVELVESRLRAPGWGPPRRLSARTMRSEWLPDTRGGRMLADYISVHYAGARPLLVWVLASEPVRGSFRQAVFATRG
jgi:hypothetical protein